jgi:hypothetical protein
MKNILTKEKAQTLKSYYLYENGDYSYKSEDGFVHLIIDNVDLLANQNSIRVWETGYIHENQYDERFPDYAYETKDGYYGIIRNKRIYLKRAICLFIFDDCYEYQTADMKWHSIPLSASIPLDVFLHVCKRIKSVLDNNNKLNF